jgi:hypothetical protein
MRYYLISSTNISRGTREEEKLSNITGVKLLTSEKTGS